MGQVRALLAHGEVLVKWSAGLECPYMHRQNITFFFSNSQAWYYSGSLTCNIWVLGHFDSTRFVDVVPHVHAINPRNMIFIYF